MMEIRDAHTMAEVFKQLELKKRDVVYLAPFVHSEFLRQLRILQMDQGFLIELMPFDRKTGQLDLEKLEYFFQRNTPKAVCAPASLEEFNYHYSWEDIQRQAENYTSNLILDADERSKLTVCLNVFM